MSQYAPRADFGPLFTPGLARHDHPATSHAAAAAIAPVSGAQRQAVLTCIYAAGDGRTDEEGIADTGIAASAYRPRRVELVAAGLVRDSGRTRKTASGRAAVVWEVAR